MHKVLLVDDEENVLNSLIRLLRKENYEVFTATSGSAGLDIIKGQNISVILSDQGMPGMMGTDFLNKVKEESPSTIRIMLTGQADIKAAMEAINKGEVYRFITKPWNDNEILMTIKQALHQYELVEENKRLNLQIREQNEQLKNLNQNLEQKVKERTAEIQKMYKELNILHKQLKESFVDSVKMFADLLELYDSYSAGHSKRVAVISSAVAKHYDLNDDELLDLEFAALLHDIGKIGIPSDIAKKDPYSLSQFEQQHYEQHPALGQICIHGIEKLQKAGVLIRHHHESFNGTGFPDGLRGENIPLGSRIMAVADAYDKLKNSRQLSKAHTEESIYSYLKKNKGVGFDPSVVEITTEFLTDRSSQREDSIEAEISISELTEGMILSKDVCSSQGVLLVPKGETVKRSYLEKLSNYAKIDARLKRVFVYKPKAS
jgi:response regulator RpfG family c-di-GMP phosphodiesterase